MKSVALPRSSSQEGLETISRNKLALLFDPVLFEIRPEVQRDKGVDLTIEIKQHGYYTNYRFAVQLKATASAKPNKDDSRPFPIDVSNINYLLNSGMPSYYILYDAEVDLFYCKSAGHVFQDLIVKHPDNHMPSRFRVRFTKILDQEFIESIYKETLDHGLMLRKLEPYLKQPRGVLIDELNDVYSVEQNIAFIDQFGYQLMNNREFMRIIEIEQRTHPRVSASPTFNMICGMAYYQQANLFKAVELLKLANREVDSFDLQAQSMLAYTLLQAKYSLGLMGKIEFKKAIKTVLNKNPPNPLLQLKRAHQTFLDGIGNDPDRLRLYYNSIQQIIAEYDNDADAIVMGYAGLLSVIGSLLLHELALNLNFTIGRSNDPLRSKIIDEWRILNGQYRQKLDDLIRFAVDQKNFLGASNLILDKSKWCYRNVFHNHAYDCWDTEEHKVKGALDRSYELVLAEQLNTIEKVVETYKMLHHVENQYSALYLKYQLLHLMGKAQEAIETAKKMWSIIEEFDLNQLKSQFVKVTNAGTEHEKFFTALADQRKHLNVVAKSSGIEAYIYAPISEEVSKFLKRDTKWSFKELHQFALRVKPGD